MFFALGPNDWANYYDPTRPDSAFVDHPYETRNYYYLTVSTDELPVAGSAARVDSIPGTVIDNGTEIHPADFRARVHAEQDIEYLPDLSPNFYDDDPGVFWEKWFWRSMAAGAQFSPDVATPAADSTQIATVRIRQWGIQSGASCGAAADDWATGAHPWGCQRPLCRSHCSPWPKPERRRRHAAQLDRP